MPRASQLLRLAVVGALVIAWGHPADAGRKRNKKKRAKQSAAAETAKKQPAAERPTGSSKRAESRLRTNQDVRLHVKPGESSKTITTLPEGESVIVLERSGRWLFVLAGEHRGWATRTQFVRANKRQRTRTATRAKSWKLADDERAEPSEPRRVAAVDTSSDTSVARVQGPPPALRDPMVATQVKLGYRSIGADYSSNGSAGIGNYLVDMAAMTTAIAARGRVLPRGSLSIELDGQYRFTYARPGIHYQSSSGATGDIPFVEHEADVGATLGVWLKVAGHPTRVAARGGFHYGAFLVDDTDNVGMMASESLAGPVAGASVRVQPHGSSYQLHVAADALLGGTRKQTAGLEDGMTSTASAVWGTAGIDVPLSAGLELGLEYSYGRAATTWSGQSARQVDVTSARRIDTSHIAFVGVGRGF